MDYSSEINKLKEEIKKLQADYKKCKEEKQKNNNKITLFNKGVSICSTKHIDGWDSVINVLKCSYDVVISNATKGYRNSTEIDTKLSEMNETSNKLARLKQDLEDLELEVTNAEKRFRNSIDECNRNISNANIDMGRIDSIIIQKEARLRQLEEKQAVEKNRPTYTTGG